MHDDFAIHKRICTMADTELPASVQEFDSNPDELVALRGAGRYFGEPTSAARCSNCHRRGHNRNKCTVVVCHACGAVGDHYELQCPKSQFCTNCGERGHFRGQCKARRVRVYCPTCRSLSHDEDRCPSIWRSYVVEKTDSIRPAHIYCYNCAGKGHYGDECGRQRVSRTPNINGSAFLGDNLPREFRSEYFKRVRRAAEEAQDDRRFPDGPSRLGPRGGNSARHLSGNSARNSSGNSSRNSSRNTSRAGSSRSSPHPGPSGLSNRIGVAPTRSGVVKPRHRR